MSYSSSRLPTPASPKTAASKPNSTPKRASRTTGSSTSPSGRSKSGATRKAPRIAASKPIDPARTFARWPFRTLCSLSRLCSLGDEGRRVFAPMRIVSLLPSLTELVCDLGCRAELVGVTHECDFPPGVERLPHLTRSRIPTSASSAEIDAMVSSQPGSLYDLDAERLAELQPELILTQEQCDVCAV